MIDVKSRPHLDDLQSSTTPPTDSRSDGHKDLLVNLRYQHRTALAVGADLINQDLHIPCDEAIPKREKLLHAGFTMSSHV